MEERDGLGLRPRHARLHEHRARRRARWVRPELAEPNLRELRLLYHGRERVLAAHALAERLAKMLGIQPIRQTRSNLNSRPYALSEERDQMRLDGLPKQVAAGT